MKVIDQDTGLEFKLYPTKEFISDLEKHHQAFDCPHMRTEIRCSMLKNGSKQMRYQCLDCGELTGNPVPHSSVSPEVCDADLVLLEEKDAVRDSARKNLYQKHIRRQKKQLRDNDRDYDRYLKSPEWREKRQKIISRAGGVCEGCGENTAIVVHHLTYDHIYDELLFELVALCDSCHAKCHSEADGDNQI